MPKTVSGKELIKFLSKKGFEIYSQKGSHVKMISKERQTKTIVPMHKEIARSTLHLIFKQAKLSEEEIKELMEE